MEHLYALGASQVALMVKNPPASSGDLRDAGLIPGLMQDWEDPLEEDMATHSSVLASRIPWTEEPGGLQSLGRRVVHGWSDIVTHSTGPPGMKRSETLRPSPWLLELLKCTWWPGDLTKIRWPDWMGERTLRENSLLKGEWWPCSWHLTGAENRRELGPGGNLVGSGYGQH